MLEFKDLTPKQIVTLEAVGYEWLGQHERHVWSMIRKDTPNVAPSGSDMFKPELWKDIHWKWFLNTF